MFSNVKEIDLKAVFFLKNENIDINNYHFILKFSKLNYEFVEKS